MKEIAGIVAEPRMEDEQRSYPEKLDFRMLGRMLRYTRPHKKRFLLLLGITILRSMQLPALAWAIGAVINGPIAGGDTPGLVRGILGFLALAVFTEFVMHFRSRLSMQLGEAVMFDLRNEMFSHLQTLTMGYYHRTRIGRIISRITSDLEAMRQGIQSVLFVSVVQGGQMLFSGLIMLYYDWLLFLIMMGMAPFIWLINREFRKRLTKANRAMQESFSRVTATLAESVGGIRITQSYVRQEVNAGFFRNLVFDHSKYSMSGARATSIFMPLLELNGQFFLSLLLLVGGMRVMGTGPAMELGDLILFFFLANLFFDPIRNLANQFASAINALAGAERVFELLDTKPDWQDPDDAVNPGELRGKVDFQNVTFSYIPGTPVLKEVNFIAEPGQSIALVGHTGSGKSSIINLVTKFYQPDSGSILLDGIDLRQIQSTALHRQMGLVQQQNFLFAGTVMDNIRMGKTGATDADVIEACRSLDSLDLIEELPDGFQTQVGERGTSLSLGQRQVICFARAMIASPRILILDEATSNIDTITEARTQAALNKLLKGRTSFIVAHRLSTIIHADLVLVLENGLIVERGNHTSLLQANGVYAGLYRRFAKATTA